jgi:RNA polymerase sigma factor (sigma-70 family)
MFRKGVTDGLSESELEAARLGFNQLLRRRRFSAQWIGRHGEEAFGQAALEYSRKLAEGARIENPPGWIIECAWRRAKSELEAEERSPDVVSTEKSRPVAERVEPSPEETLLDSERFAKVRAAVAELSADRRRILALSYFEGFSVRQAGERLRWHPSKAQRAHEGAKRQLHELLGVGAADQLEVEIGLAAYLSLATGASAAGRFPAAHALLERGTQKAAEGLAALKQHAASAYSRAVDPTPLAGAHPGTVAAVVAGCVTIGSGATYCAQQGVDPFGAAQGLLAGTQESKPKPSPPPEPAEPPPPASPPPVSEERASTEVAQSPPPAEAEPSTTPEPPPPPPPPEQSFEPASPDYVETSEAAPESQSSEGTATESARPAPVSGPGPQFGGP